MAEHILVRTAEAAGQHLPQPPAEIAEALPEGAAPFVPLDSVLAGATSVLKSAVLLSTTEAPEPVKAVREKLLAYKQPGIDFPPHLPAVRDAVRNQGQGILDYDPEHDTVRRIEGVESVIALHGTFLATTLETGVTPSVLHGNLGAPRSWEDLTDLNHVRHMLTILRLGAAANQGITIRKILDDLDGMALSQRRISVLGHELAEAKLVDINKDKREHLYTPSPKLREACTDVRDALVMMDFDPEAFIASGQEKAGKVMDARYLPFLHKNSVVRSGRVKRPQTAKVWQAVHEKLGNTPGGQLDEEELYHSVGVPLGYDKERSFKQVLYRARVTMDSLPRDQQLDITAPTHEQRRIYRKPPERKITDH